MYVFYDFYIYRGLSLKMAIGAIVWFKRFQFASAQLPEGESRALAPEA